MIEFLNLTFIIGFKKREKALGDGVNLFSHERTFPNLQRAERPAFGSFRPSLM
ncbi:hypothetical protein LEP1GSC158_4882 [Leptospira interrogans serovar Zanoni str. LT2156]|uniref:Uncharacterized protein n=1 Tax=Leptospira interrogans serovar Zanoni str. LT2156 TaxID=1001601 RepID=M6HF56_LEPIR|nr:hypothetical protein LEP1GSC158_4882 [Leptospira interrogans serovar Zanoni str. LT2156]